MEEIKYIVLGKKEFFELFINAGFRYLPVENPADVFPALDREEKPELIITQDSFYHTVQEYADSRRFPVTVFSFPENLDRDTADEHLRRMIIRAVGMDIG